MNHKGADQFREHRIFLGLNLGNYYRVDMCTIISCFIVSYLSEENVVRMGYSSFLIFPHWPQKAYCQWLLLSFVSFSLWKQLINTGDILCWLYFLELSIDLWPDWVTLHCYKKSCSQPWSTLPRCPVAFPPCTCRYICTLKEILSSLLPWPSQPCLQSLPHLQDLLSMKCNLMPEISPACSGEI